MWRDGSGGATRDGRATVPPVPPEDGRGPDPRIRPLLIGSDIYRASIYGGGGDRPQADGARHPLAIPRVSLTIDLLRLLGWLPDDAYVDSPRASPAQLARFHDPDYIAAVQQAEAAGRASEAVRVRYNIGRAGNPIYGEMFRRPATACGASILAASLLQDGGIVHSLAGGTHHALRDSASGFCFFNDPVLALLALLDGGLERVAYVDIDAHHGDGVEIAFRGDPRLLYLSVHERDRWPFTGTEPRSPCGMIRNYAVPAGMNDSEMRFLFDMAIQPLLEDFAPQAIVLQCGADALADDPLSKQMLSNNAHWDAVRRLRPLAPRFLVLGGGGYNPWSAARCWAGVWAALNDLPVPARLPAAAEALLRGVTWRRSQGRNPPAHWFETLRDPAREGEIREDVRRLAAT